MDLEIIKPHVGSVVHAEPRALVDGSLSKQILELVEERGVLVFPRIGLSDEEQVAFTRALGGRSAYLDHPGVDAKGVYTVTLDPTDNPNPDYAAYIHGTFFWHFDGVISPPKATMLSARGVAAKGGQTEFANTYAACAQMPEALKAEIDGLRVVHSLYAILKSTVAAPTPEDLARWAEISPAPEVQRLVRTEPSGRKSLTIGASADYIEHMPVMEGRALLARLQDWAAQPDFTYQHQWRAGDLVIWDNIGVMHRAVAYSDPGRRMTRTSVAAQRASAPV